MLIIKTGTMVSHTEVTYSITSNEKIQSNTHNTLQKRNNKQIHTHEAKKTLPRKKKNLTRNTALLNKF